MIAFNGKTRLTSPLEKDFVSLGGADPEKTLSQEELSMACEAAIEFLDEHHPEFLKRIYMEGVKRGDFPPL